MWIYIKTIIFLSIVFCAAMHQRNSYAQPMVDDRFEQVDFEALPEKNSPSDDFAGVYTIIATYKNISTDTISDITVVVNESKGLRLLKSLENQDNLDNKNESETKRLIVLKLGDYSDNRLSKGEKFEVRFRLGIDKGFSNIRFSIGSDHTKIGGIGLSSIFSAIMVGTVRTVITPKTGGEIEVVLMDGAKIRIEVPPGAVLNDQEIWLGGGSTDVSSQQGALSLGEGVETGPDGFELLLPALITLQYPQEIIDSVAQGYGISPQELEEGIMIGDYDSETKLFVPLTLHEKDIVKNIISFWKQKL